MKVTEERWKEANTVESTHWEKIMSDDELAQKEDGHYRHADVMLLGNSLPKELTVIDIGGGPLSLITHYDLSLGVVVDPIMISDKYLKKYKERNILFVNKKAEDFLSSYDGPIMDEVWMYNCLQHTIDPEYIMKNLWKAGKYLRISEPTDTPINTAHPHSFTPEWYQNMLTMISERGEWKRIDYDYPYVGGLWKLIRHG
jgi:hypothetical protein